jgi:glycogen operon protein
MRPLRARLASLIFIAMWPAHGWAWTAVESAPSDQSSLGAHIDAQGWIHFGMHSPEADLVRLLLFEDARAKTPSQVVPMQKSGEDWRIKIRGAEAKPGLHYMYQAAGPRNASLADPHATLFNENYPLGDPYAYKTENVRFSDVFASTPFADISAPVYAGGGKSVVYDQSRDAFPGHVVVRPENLIVYELHVQDYTARIASLSPKLRGTYLGLAHGGLKTPGGLAAGIDHLAELGVTAVELMPVMEYDEETGNAAGRLNHWGYMTSNFFAPESRYASVDGQQVVELKELVRALHQRGIAVFMDVVYNHTAEGTWAADGRLAAKCYSFMCSSLIGVYRATPDGRFFSNSTGTGNDVDFTGPDNRFTKTLVRDSLALWYQTYGIDGFRFDLARILADGSQSAADWVDNDSRFAAAHLHAEPWDLGGVWWDFMDNYGYSSANNRWAKWLGQYRDLVRRFSQSGLKNRSAFKRLIEGYGQTDSGSPASTKPWRSVNFIAVHDGYTLRDCTFFNDGGGSHNCWNSDGNEDLRRERSKLLIGILLTSQGVPLIQQGDEFGATKSGAASQDDAHNTYNYESATGDAAVNRVSWIDWRLKDGDTSGSPNAPAYGNELFNWTKDLIALRRTWSHFRRADFPQYIDGAPNDNQGERNDGRFTYVWEGPGDGSPTQLAVVWWGKAGEPDLMVVYNEHWEPFAVDNLANWSKGNWKVLARSWVKDQGCTPADWQAKCPDAGGRIEVNGRSMAILVSDNN